MLVDDVIILQVYRRELEEGGVVIDPLKASYTVKVSVCTEFTRTHRQNVRISRDGSTSIAAPSPILLPPRV